LTLFKFLSKSTRFFSVFILLLSVLFICSCDGIHDTQPVEYKYFNDDLQGTWSSNTPGLYSRTLVINSTTITIDGYGEDWTSLVGDDSKRPFKDFPKRVPLKGYSEEGRIFIEYGGSAQNGISYIYTEVEDYPNLVKLLEFDFGGRKEIVQSLLKEIN